METTKTTTARLKSPEELLAIIREKDLTIAHQNRRLRELEDRHHADLSALYLAKQLLGAWLKDLKRKAIPYAEPKVRNRPNNWDLLPILLVALVLGSCSARYPLSALAPGAHLPGFVARKYTRINDSTYFNPFQKVLYYRAPDGIFYPCKP